MARVIRRQSGSKRRAKRVREMAAALRRAAEDSCSMEERRDLLAFLLGGLDDIAASVEETAAAWERRNYWVKADRFRHEWRWAPKLAEELSSALVAGDWDRAVRGAASIAPHLPSGPGLASAGSSLPWEGAWRGWQELNAADRSR